MREPLKVFITYLHEDPQENEDVKTHLAIMEKKAHKHERASYVHRKQ